MTTSTPRPPVAAPDPAADPVPAFEPHPWIANPHLQTILGRYWSRPGLRLPSTYAEVDAGDGDRLSVLESTPEGWSPGDPTALLVHGLAGCARSPYVVRVGRKLVALGVRVVRMNLRGAGTGFGLARSIYHGGRSDDLRAVAGWIAGRAPGSPIGLVGFSLGANLALKLAGEAADRPVEGLDCVVASNPPLDLHASSRRILEPRNRIYNRTFLRSLRAEVVRLHATFPELTPVDLSSARSVLHFDELYTAPRNGFLDATDYYKHSSAGPKVPRIEVPGLVIHAVDDPFVPAEPFRSIAFPPGLALELIPQGGHLGYLNRRKIQGDHRWLDARIIAWLTTRWRLGPIRPTGNPRREGDPAGPLRRPSS